MRGVAEGGLGGEERSAGLVGALSVFSCCWLVTCMSGCAVDGLSVLCSGC